MYSDAERTAAAFVRQRESASGFAARGSFRPCHCGGFRALKRRRRPAKRNTVCRGNANALNIYAYSCMPAQKAAKIASEADVFGNCRALNA